MYALFCIIRRAEGISLYCLNALKCNYIIFFFIAFFFFKGFSYLFIYLFIYLFLAVLGLHCCVQSFSSCGERGLLFVVVCGLLIAAASLVAEHGLQAHGLQ